MADQGLNLQPLGMLIIGIDYKYYRKTLSLPQKGDDGIWTQCYIAQEKFTFLVTKKYQFN